MALFTQQTTENFPPANLEVEISSSEKQSEGFAQSDNRRIENIDQPDDVEKEDIKNRLECADDSNASVGLYDYLVGELRRGYLLENDEQRYMERREKFYMFMKIPREVEKFEHALSSTTPSLSVWPPNSVPHFSGGLAYGIVKMKQELQRRAFSVITAPMSDADLVYKLHNKLGEHWQAQTSTFMFYGIFQCADAFLFVFTLLPLRFSLALWFLVSRSFKNTVSYVLKNECGGGGSGTVGRKVLQPAEICDLLKGVILIIVSFLMTYVDTSMLYHIVKSQSVIKLYIFFNMLEVADKLFSSFGQDIMDALFWTATEPRDRKREHFGLLPHLLMVVVYVFMHSLLVLLQATTLNVAINSKNKALLTIMMSNNFVELKSMVFKKFEKNNLFQMSCSDVRERFHYVILLLVVIIQTLKEYNWSGEQFCVLFPDCILVLLAEVLVDWIKHAFITRFNEIPCEVYGDYTVSLAYDLASSKLKNAYSDHSDLISRRMGFIPLPLGAVVFRVVIGSISVSGILGFLSLFLGCLCLFSFKVLNNILLLGRACDLIEHHRKYQKEKVPPPRQCNSLPPSRHHSFEDLPTTVAHAKSTPHSLNPSVSSSLADISAQVAILQETLEPSPMFCNSTVSLNSLGLNEGLGEHDAHDGGMLTVDYEGIRRRASAGISLNRKDGPKRRVSLQEYPQSHNIDQQPPPTA